MEKKIDCFVNYAGHEATQHTVNQLRACGCINDVYVLVTDGINCDIEGVETLTVDSPDSMKAWALMAQKATSPMCLLCRATTAIDLSYEALSRMAGVMCSGDVAMMYADRNERKADGTVVRHPVIDMQMGSVRDDFDFGTVLLVQTRVMSEFVTQHLSDDWHNSALYAMQLWLLEKQSGAGVAKPQIFHLKEYMYTEVQADARLSGERQFDYVNPRNRDVQIERERVFTKHLSNIGLLKPQSMNKTAVANEGEWPVVASVIIPVRNRVRTIEDAVNSVLSQECDFAFNVIVVDNHSTDGTTEVMERLAKADSRVKHIVPDRDDLGIGGCWSTAFRSEHCGCYSVQLDSDDLYSSPATLQQIVNKFREEKVAMVIGSYRMCNFQLETLPPGIIDHREWTDENGANNALRINGLGAPRAFNTSVLREVGMPNTSYGEDYAVGLAICRSYRIGRIYDELYLCRRWEGNSDAALSQEQTNRNNAYKDSIRTMEMMARMSLYNVYNL